MRHIGFLFVLIVFVIQSCKIGTHKYYGNDNIDSDITEQIHSLNEQIIESVLTNNSGLLKKMMSSKLIEKNSFDIDTLLQQVNTIIKERKYKTVDEYHMKSSETEMNFTIVSESSLDHGYKILYQAVNEENFISLILPESKIDNFIIAIFYGKYNEKWKLNGLKLGQYIINGKTATEHFKQAQSEYDKGYLVDAISSMGLASKCLKPFPFWEYNQSKEIIDFRERLANEVNDKYSLPMVLNEIKSAPEIYNIMPFGMNEGYFPMVKYVSGIDVKDTIALKQENQQIQKVIGQIFTGIDKEKSMVFYKAVNELPNGLKPVPSYGFIQKIK